MQHVRGVNLRKDGTKLWTSFDMFGGCAARDNDVINKRRPVGATFSVLSALFSGFTVVY